jgi:tetratricopeptide (TPR) repeat protein
MLKTAFEYYRKNDKFDIRNKDPYIKHSYMVRKLLFIAFVFSSSLSIAGNVTDLLKSGETKNKAGKYQEALTDYDQAISLNQAETDKYLKNLEQYSHLSDFEKASIDNAEIFETKHDLAVPYYGRGVANAGLGNKDAAMKDFEMAIKIDSKYGDAYCERGLLKHAMGNKDEGCIDLRTGADLGSAKAKDEYETHFCWNSSLNYAKEGLSKYRLKQYDAALTDFNLAVKLNPDSAVNFLRRGLCYYGMGKFDKALEDFTKASEINPANPEYMYNKGLAYYSQEKHQLAFDEFSKAIKINVNYYDAYLYRGYTCEGLGNAKSAIYDYAQAMRIKPNEGLPCYRSALLKQEAGDKKGACMEFKKAAELGIEDAEGYAAECK